MKRGTRADLRGVRQADVMADHGIDNVLEIPDFKDSDQFTYRWLRVKMGSEDDVANINSRLRQGWTFVREEDIPQETRAAFILPVIKSGLAQLNGVVQNGDLALAKISREKAEAILQQAIDAAARQMQAVESKLIGYEDSSGARHTFTNDSRKRIRLGREAHLDI